MESRLLASTAPVGLNRACLVITDMVEKYRYRAASGLAAENHEMLLAGTQARSPDPQAGRRGREIAAYRGGTS